MVDTMTITSATRPGVLPGLAVCAAATAAAVLVHALMPVVSPLLIAIGLGVLVSNTVGVAPRWRPGMSVAARPLLRLGVALLGLQLVAGDLFALGAGLLTAVVII